MFCFSVFDLVHFFANFAGAYFFSAVQRVSAVQKNLQNFSAPVYTVLHSVHRKRSQKCFRRVHGIAQCTIFEAVFCKFFAVLTFQCRSSATSLLYHIFSTPFCSGFAAVIFFLAPFSSGEAAVIFLNAVLHAVASPLHIFLSAVLQRLRSRIFFSAPFCSGCAAAIFFSAVQIGLIAVTAIFRKSAKKCTLHRTLVYGSTDEMSYKQHDTTLFNIVLNIKNLILLIL